LVSKKDREEFYFVAPTSVKKSSTKKEFPSTEKPITHSLETLSLFADVKVTPPAAIKDIETTLKQLEAKISELKDLQVKEIASRKEKRSEREAALAKAVEAYEKAASEAKKLSPREEEDY
jgi:hypothetical protein